MKNLLTKGIGLLPALLLPASVMAHEPVYGVCRMQIADYVAHHLGQTVTRIDIRNYTERERVVDHGDALVYVKECPGVHYFEVFGTETVCEHIPHYGQQLGSYVRYEGAGGGCSKTG